MRFEGEFRVPGRPEEVIHRFADVARMARCMPGAELEGQAEDGAWLGAMVVVLGPKRFRFRGRVTAAVDPTALTGSLHGRGAADLRAARIGVRLTYALREEPGPVSVVSLVSEAELGGVLADFARTGGVAVATAMMAEFSRRVAQEFAAEASPASPAVEPASLPAPESLRLHRLLWAMVRAKLLAIAASLWRRPKPATPPS